MAIKYKTPQDRIVIDINGPQGTAIELLGQAALWMTQMNRSHEQIGDTITKMTSGDYETMITIFNQQFQSFCDLIR
jgi:hypothetical protein